MTDYNISVISYTNLVEKDQQFHRNLTFCTEEGLKSETSLQ